MFVKSKSESTIFTTPTTTRQSQGKPNFKERFFQKASQLFHRQVNNNQPPKKDLKFKANTCELNETINRAEFFKTNILHSKDFKKFLEARQAFENLDFYSKVGEYEKLWSEETADEQAKKICEQFKIKKGSSFDTLNLDCDVKTNILSAIDSNQTGKELFAEAKAMVFGLLFEDMYQKYLRHKDI